MAKSKTHYTCQACGSVFGKWSGKCDDCGEWDTVVEDQVSEGFTRTSSGGAGKIIPFSSLVGDVRPKARRETGITELDRVLGGGLVAGSAVLVGGDPGIGKSTILLQAVAALRADGGSGMYITGEESIEQVQMRAQRLGVAPDGVLLAAATSVSDIIASIKKHKPDVVVIDSIQTMFLATLESAPGTVGQVRASSHELIQCVKQTGSALLLVGHVTKEGQIAGPKVLEHMVDTVLYFEGERGHQFRILRAVKNRFGGANEIGVFEMTEKGLAEVANPSSLFISGKAGEVSGSVIFAGMEGTRPVLVEIQALVVPTGMATPRRAVVGWDTNRLAMLLAVLQRRLNMPFMDKEVYLNVAGGLRITEPAADLAVMAALISAKADIPFPKGSIVFGEVGLSGEVRKVGRSDMRIKEAEKLGFERGIVPGDSTCGSKHFIINEITYIRQLMQVLSSD